MNGDAWVFGAVGLLAAGSLVGRRGSRFIRRQGVSFPDLDTYFAFDRAVEALYGDVAWWVYRGSHKDTLFRHYRELDDIERAALDLANAAVLGTEPLTLYRRMRGSQRQGLAGASLTDDPDLFDNAVSFQIRPDQVLACYRTPGFDRAFGGKTYGHEREYILKPDVQIEGGDAR